jgi:hypothetical protein
VGRCEGAVSFLLRKFFCVVELCYGFASLFCKASECWPSECVGEGNRSLGHTRENRGNKGTLGNAEIVVRYYLKVMQNVGCCFDVCDVVMRRMGGLPG